MSERSQPPEPKEKIVHDFADGHRIVQLQNLLALVNEDKALKHHLFFEQLDDPDYREKVHRYLQEQGDFYVLRDADGRSLAMMQTTKPQHGGGREIVTCKAYKFAHPSKEEMKCFIEFAKKKRMSLDDDPYNCHTGRTGMIEKNGVFYDIYDLPKDFRYHGSLSFVDNPEADRDEMRALRKPTLPDGLILEGDLDLTNSPLTKLPARLNVRSLYLDGSKVQSIPEDLIVRRSLMAADSPVASAERHSSVEGDEGDLSLLPPEKPAITKKMQAILDAGPKSPVSARSNGKSGGIDR